MRLAVLVFICMLLVGCGSAEEQSAQSTTTTSEGAAADGRGRHVSAARLTEPPRSSGIITAEQAEGVSGTVIEAWLNGDRGLGDRFSTASDAIAPLFAVRPPSQKLTDGGRAYCSEDEETGSFTGCSYSVVDDSPDGIFAVATELTVASSLVVVRSAGPADWND